MGIILNLYAALRFCSFCNARYRVYFKLRPMIYQAIDPYGKASNDEDERACDDACPHSTPAILRVIRSLRIRLLKTRRGIAQLCISAISLHSSKLTGHAWRWEAKHLARRSACPVDGPFCVFWSNCVRLDIVAFSRHRL